MARTKDISKLPDLSEAVAESAKTLAGVCVALTRFRRNSGAVKAFYDLAVKAAKDVADSSAAFIAAVRSQVESSVKAK
jgi:hypothetical protein